MVGGPLVSEEGKVIGQLKLLKNFDNLLVGFGRPQFF